MAPRELGDDVTWQALPTWYVPDPCANREAWMVTVPRLTYLTHRPILGCADTCYPRHRDNEFSTFLNRGTFTSAPDLINTIRTFADAYDERCQPLALDQDRRPDPHCNQPSKKLRYATLASELRL